MKWKEAIFAHNCRLPREEDIFYRFIPKETRLAKLLRAIHRNMTISEENIQARRYFKSRSAIKQESVRHLLTYFYIIHPYSIFRQTWDNVMLVVYIYALIVIPMYSCFVNYSIFKHTYIAWVWADVIHCLICLVDIAINLSTGYVARNPKDINLVPWKIFRKYLAFYLIIDLVTSIPLDHICCALNVRCQTCQYAAEIRLLKFFRVPTMRTYVNRLAEQTNMTTIMAQVTCVVLFAILLFHLCTCLLYLVTMSTMHMVEASWMLTVYFQSLPLYKKYIMCFTEASSAVLATGHIFNMTESLPYEMFSVFLATLGTMGYMLVFGKAVQWCSTLWAPTIKYEEVEEQVKTYTRCKKLPTFLQNRLTSYYEYRFQKSFFQEAQILSVLSSSLKEEIVMHSCRRLVEKVSFFNNIPTSMLVRVVVCLRSEIFLVNDVIMKAGSPGDCMYFITSGTVAVYSSSGKEMCHLEDGAHFGEVALVMEEARRVCSVVAVQICELHRLDRSDFRRVVAPYPDLLMRIERIAEERLEENVVLDRRHRRSLKKRRRSAQRD